MEHIIHQTWKTNQLDSDQTEWTTSVKRQFSDYEYKFWSDEDNENLIKISYPEFYDFYKSLLPIEKGDFIRNLYIYHFGGIYLDIDVRMNKPLILEGADMYLCDQTKEANSIRIQLVIDPFFLAGNKGCKFFYEICASMVRGAVYKQLSLSYDSIYSLKTLFKTGPIMLTKFYLLNKHKYNIKVLKDVFTTELYESELPKDQYYGVHIQFNSWIKESERKYKKKS